MGHLKFLDLPDKRIPGAYVALSTSTVNGGVLIWG